MREEEYKERKRRGGEREKGEVEGSDQRIDEYSIQWAL
jgi:hypothetical protein